MNNTVKRVIFTVMMIASILFAANVSLHEVDGSMVMNANRTKGPKALVKANFVKHKKKNEQKNVYANQDVFHVALRDSVHWLEVEKNTVYTICTDDVNDGIWKGTDFSYTKKNNCIQLNSGNYVKHGRVWYVTNMGNVHTFNLLVGMKFINLSNQNHLLGYNSFDDIRSYGDHSISFKFIDSARYEKMNEILIVDTYKVTECEFIHALWDSIPSQGNEYFPDNNNFWIEKKKSIRKDGRCDIHDSAAIRVYLYHALVYANMRSLRDGFRPVYSFEKTKDISISFKKYNDGSFNIAGASFFPSHLDENNYIHVTINENADGYRLPYYNEWVALARGGEGNANYKTPWGNKKDSVKAAQYAWFGVIDPDDPFAKMSKDNSTERRWLNMSCGDWLQKSRPVGMLKPNAYGLYDIFGLVCENVLMPGKSLFSTETSSCKGGYLTTPLENLTFGNHCDNDRGYFYTTFQGLRLVRQIR